MKTNIQIHKLFEMLIDLQKDMEKTQNLVLELKLDINEIQNNIKEANIMCSYNTENIGGNDKNENIKINEN